MEKSKLAFQSKAFIVASAIENVPPELSVWEYLEGTLQNQLYQPQVEKLSLLRVRAKEWQNLDWAVISFTKTIVEKENSLSHMGQFLQDGENVCFMSFFY